MEYRTKTTDTQLRGRYRHFNVTSSAPACNPQWGCHSRATNSEAVLAGRLLKAPHLRLLHRMEEGLHSVPRRPADQHGGPGQWWPPPGSPPWDHVCVPLTHITAHRRGSAWTGGIEAMKTGGHLPSQVGSGGGDLRWRTSERDVTITERNP